MQDPSSSRSALPVLPPAQTKPILPQGIHPARPPPQGHKNPALIFPVHAGRFLLKSSCPHGFHPYLLIPALRRKFVFRSLHLFFQLSDVFHHFRPSPTVPIYRQFFRFLPQIPGMCCPADSPPEMLSPDSTRHRPKVPSAQFFHLHPSFLSHQNFHLSSRYERLLPEALFRLPDLLSAEQNGSSSL